MKWFKVDSNTPDDPKIRGLIKRHGNAGFGALVRLWCYVAAHGSSKRPGWAIDSNGRAIEKSVLVDAAGMDEHSFDEMLSLLADMAHVAKKPWLERQTLVFPAMSKRSDVYSQRVVRTKFAQPTYKVPLEEKRSEEKRRSSTPPRVAVDNGRPKPYKPQDRAYWTVYHIAMAVIGKISTKDQLDHSSIKEEVKQACARKDVAYDATVVSKALEAAMVARAKIRTLEVAK